MATQLPPAFCWTKMGDEAGQSLRGILARKNTERALTGGTFYWGIGASLGKTIWSFIQENETPYILFSPMRAKAKPVDVNPEKVFAWTAYLDQHGRKHCLTQLALVTSRGSVGEKIKNRHYALVCERSQNFESDFTSGVRWSELRNYSSGNHLGYSQVTAVVRRQKPSQIKCHTYPILLSAKLVPPYFVTLVDPVEIPRESWRKASLLWSSAPYSESEWKNWLRKNRASFLPVGQSDSGNSSAFRPSQNVHAC